MVFLFIIKWTVFMLYDYNNITPPADAQCASVFFMHSGINLRISKNNFHQNLKFRQPFRYFLYYIYIIIY